jgi:hypothetical protein
MLTSSSSTADRDTFNSNLPERFRSNFRSSSTPSDTMPSNGYRTKLNLGIRQYAEAQEKITTNNPGQWQSLPEIPTSKEIALTDMEDVTVGANKIRGKWKSKDKYLQAHYELLREDSISPIRDAVDAVRKSPGMLDNPVAAIYEKVSQHSSRDVLRLTPTGPHQRVYLCPWRSSCTSDILDHQSRCQHQLAIELPLGLWVHSSPNACKRQLQVQMCCRHRRSASKSWC